MHGALGNNKEKGDPFSKVLSSFSFLLKKSQKVFCERIFFFFK